MKLWHLLPIGVGGHWSPWYDKAFGFVVRAESETEARALAAKVAGDEGEVAWTDKGSSTCIELTADGEAGVVIRDYHWRSGAR